MSGISFQKLVDKKDKKTQSESTPAGARSGTGYFYQTGIVREFIGEPDIYLSLRKGNLPEVDNIDDYEIMTKNCLIAYIIDGSEANKGKPPVICYPFFPHLSLPIKAGEHVWLLKEEFHGRDVYYWLSRKSGFKQTDDINYTHAERFGLIEDRLNKNNPGNKKTQNRGNLFDKSSDDEELDAAVYTSFDIPIQENLPIGLNNNTIIKASHSFINEFTAEPTPSVRRKCGDTLIQGSNNTLVHLTTEKFKTNVNNRREFTGLATEPDLPGRYPFSPAIDLCVGRKKEELTELKNTTGDSAVSGAVEILKGGRGIGYSEFESYEIDKLGNLLDKSKKFDTSLSIDIDATNCGARLYLSNNCAIDETFGSSFDVLDTLGGSGLATYAEHNRMIADGSLRLTNRIGQSFLNMDSEGNVVIKSSIDNGQQFLSLINNGVSRLQARDKIELAVSSDNDNEINTVDEPYVLYSELKTILDKILSNLLILNNLYVDNMATTIPLVITTSAAAIAAGNAPGTPAHDDAVALAMAPALSAATSAATAATGQVKIEIADATRTGTGKIAAGPLGSTKIFGESN